MKRLLSVLALAVFAHSALAVVPVPYREAVSFSFHFGGTGNALMSVYDGDTNPSVEQFTANGPDSDIRTASLQPGKAYTVNFQSSGILSYTLSFIAPEGYAVYLDGFPTDMISGDPRVDGSSHDYTLELRPVATIGADPLGNFSGVKVGKAVSWEIGLGMLRSGRSAGRIIFKERDVSAAGSSQRLYYAPPGNYGDIQVFYQPGSSNQYLRQVSVPQGIVDIVDASGGYWLKLYTHAQAEGHQDLPYTFTGNPWKTIHVEAPAANQMRITETEGSVSRVSFLALTSGSIASGTYVWTLQEGDGSAWARTTTHMSTNLGASREDVVAVRTGGSAGTIVAKTKYVYETPSSMDEVVTQIIDDPDGAALTKTFTYHTTSTEYGNYRRVKTVTEPTGNWSGFRYYDDWNRRGQLQYDCHPYVDSPASAPASLTSTRPTTGRVISYDYGANWSGRYSRLSTQTERVNDVVTGSTTMSYTDTLGSGWPRETATATVYRDASNTQVSAHEQFRGDAGFDEPFRVYQDTGPDGTRTSYNRCAGDFNESTGEFTANGNIGCWRQIAVHGTTNSSGAEAISQWGGQSFAQLYVVPSKSTMDVTIWSGKGSVLRTETWVFTGSGNFSRLTWQRMTYDDAGRLLTQVDNNGSTVSNVYTNGRLTGGVDATGVETTYTYDEIGRVQTATKKGASSMAAALTTGYNYQAQPDVTTTNVYDGADRVRTATVSAGTLSLVTSKDYDLAGRLQSQTEPGGFTTSYVYSAGGKIVTATLPGNATKVTEVYLDGQPKSVSGTAVVSEYSTYWIDGSGRKCSQQTIGGVTSAWTNTVLDWLGRKVEVWRPSPTSGTNNAWMSYYNSSGQLWKTTQPGQAATLYAYDSLGVQYRQGLDVNGNDSLDLSGTDRITETGYSLSVDSSSRGVKQTTTKVYGSPNSGSATTTATSTEYLSGMAAGVVKQVTEKDIHGNETTTTTTVDRTGKRVTTTTDLPDSSVDTAQVSYNGLSVESRDAAGAVTRVEYDGLGRAVTAIDPRTGSTTTAYRSGSSLVETVTDANSVTTATYAYDAAGRVFSLRNAAGNYTYTTYNSRGQTEHVWGDVPYPVEYGYDSSGRQTKLRTYRGGSGWTAETWPSQPGTADETTWNFDPATGLLGSKVDAAGKSVSYTYTTAGQVLTRKWARDVTTTYAYSGTTGELTSVSYSDSTTPVSYTYNRRGQIETVSDDTGTRTLHYSPTNFLNTDETLSSYYNGRVITWKYDTTSGVVGRNAGFSLGLPANLTGENDISYGYDTYGRFNALSANLGGAAAGSFTYGYTPSSSQIGSLSESASGLVQSRGYELHRDLVSTFGTTLGSRTLANYGYTNDELGRRTVKVETGEMYSRYGTGLTTKYGYNARNEVTSANTYLGTDAAVAGTAAGDALQGRSFYYGYDNIGNRETTTTNGQSSTYTNNNLNQVKSRTVPGYADVSGFAAANAAVTVAGQPTTRQFDYFYRQHPVNNAANSLWGSFLISASGPGGTSSETRNQYIARSLEEFSYDDDGNLLGDGRWNYVWDAENRLVSMTTTSLAVSAGVPQQVVQFTYDYLGRRVQKTVNGNSRRFIYSTTNWHLLAEYNADNGNSLIRAYSWGLDLSRSTTGAGGVGGLLSIYDTATAAAYLPVYDANGNVFALINRATTSIAAAYEYSAFGETLRATGPFADANPFRFSTKYTDTETQLVYYGYRYYAPSLGRWLGRDPQQEAGGFNLFGFCTNNGVNIWDVLGLGTPTCDAGQLPLDEIFAALEQMVAAALAQAQSMAAAKAAESIAQQQAVDQNGYIGAHVFGMGRESNGYFSTSGTMTITAANQSTGAVVGTMGVTVYGSAANVATALGVAMDTAQATIIQNNRIPEATLVNAMTNAPMLASTNSGGTGLAVNAGGPGYASAATTVNGVVTATETLGATLSRAPDAAADAAIYFGANALEKTAMIGEAANIVFGASTALLGSFMEAAKNWRLADVLSTAGKFASASNTGIAQFDSDMKFVGSSAQLLGGTCSFGTQLKNYGYDVMTNANNNYLLYGNGYWSAQFYPFPLHK